LYPAGASKEYCQKLHIKAESLTMSYELIERERVTFAVYYCPAGFKKYMLAAREVNVEP